MKKAWVGSLLCLMCACSHVWAEDALFPVVVRFHWLANVEFAGILEAKERGWYAEAGLDVTPKGWENGVSGLDEVATGKAHIGVGIDEQTHRPCPARRACDQCRRLLRRHIARPRGVRAGWRWPRLGDHRR